MRGWPFILINIGLVLIGLVLLLNILSATGGH